MFIYVVPIPAPPALLAVAVANVFEVLGVAAALWDGGDAWRSIHVHSDVIWFEVEHGAEAEREKHNKRCLERARNKGETVLGEHRGLCDLFVPIATDGRVAAVLATGPFATARPTSAYVLERWHWLTGRHGHPADPEFSHFLSATLSTLVLEGTQAQAFQRLAALLARLIAGGSAPSAEADALRTKLEEARNVERMWDAARSMVDDRTSRSWSSSYRQPWALGLTRLPDQALVGLIVSRDAKPDPVDDLLRRDALQRACVRIARTAGNCVAGQVGGHGIMLLSAASGSAQRKRQRLLELSERVSRSARDFGFRLHIGLDTVSGRASPAASYRAALSAAESALSQGARTVDTAREPPRKVLALHRMVEELVAANPSALPARFDHYLETVGSRCGYRLEPTRAYVEAGFERLAATLLDSGALDDKGLADLSAELETAAGRANTVIDLFAAYRRAVSDLCETVQRPPEARRDLSLRRALSYIDRHYTEPLSLPEVAKIAGYAQNHFSVLFKKKERMTFEHYVRRLRIERAKLLLGTHELDVQQVGHLAGFRERHYFTHVFKEAVGVTPTEYRRTRA
jgi:AraC-like DNA-binding protein